MVSLLSEDERRMILDIGRKLIDHDVRPIARELKQDDRYPEDLIEQMRDIGIFGLTVPRACATSATRRS